MVQNEIQRRIKRSKQSERDLGHWLQEHDGVDPKWVGVASSASRVGHITGLQFDNISPHYVAENKQVRMPIKMLTWWLQIVGIAAIQGKDALLRIEPTNVLNIKGVRKRPMDMHVITAERHAELLKKEQRMDACDEDQCYYDPTTDRMNSDV